jgi:hypothetical protein
MTEKKDPDEDLFEDVENIEGEEGQWVAIRNGKTIKTSHDSAELYALAENFPAGEVCVTKILYAGACFY